MLTLEPYINFTDCLHSGIQYSGSEKKLGILYHNEPYMLKFRKNINGRKTFSHISEYLASHIIAMAGIDVHETLLGIYGEEEVVAVKDFIAGTGYTLNEFAATGDSSYDTEREEHTAYTYDEIIYLARQHVKIENPQKIIERFWDMFVLDALLANFDRHGYNWGFMKSKEEYKLAPVYDNGSSLFPRLIEDELLYIVNSEEELQKRTYLFPTSQIKMNGRKSSYYDVIHSHRYSECDRAIDRIFSVLDFGEIDTFIRRVPNISEQRKHFYQTIIKYRRNHIFG